MSSALASTLGRIMSTCSQFIILLIILGYVLDCLPSMTTGWKSVEEQLSFLKELDLKPDVIINLKVQVYHLVNHDPLCYGSTGIDSCC